MLRVEFNNATVMDALTKLLERVDNPTPALIKIGEKLANSTKQRFRDSQGPDGKSWKGNEKSTIDMYNRMFGQLGAKKPLIGESRDLSSEISWQLTDRGVEIGSPTPYANMQQFGGTKAQWPHLWGDIPARPYLGISSADEASILDIVRAYLAPD